ncbi:MAG: hypothetical protein HN341_01900 [Verrucomicrobia bacterium]|jgi:hypothetical protein|nr:hypothetical protein [Verrucomicrobiota bacterium]
MRLLLAVLAFVTLATVVSAEPYKEQTPPPGSLVLDYCKSQPNSRWVPQEYLGKVKDLGIENCWIYYIKVRAARAATVSADGLKVMQLDSGLWIVSKAMSKNILQTSY